MWLHVHSTFREARSVKTCTPGSSPFPLIRLEAYLVPQVWEQCLRGHPDQEERFRIGSGCGSQESVGTGSRGTDGEV